MQINFSLYTPSLEHPNCMRRLNITTTLSSFATSSTLTHLSCRHTSSRLASSSGKSIPNKPAFASIPYLSTSGRLRRCKRQAIVHEHEQASATRFPKHALATAQLLTSVASHNIILHSASSLMDRSKQPPRVPNYSPGASKIKHLHSLIEYRGFETVYGSCSFCAATSFVASLLTPWEVAKWLYR